MPPTPQLAKLGILPGTTWSVVDRPHGWNFETPADASLEVTAGDSADVVLVFAREAAALPAIFAAQEPRIFPAGALWIAWPRKAAGHVSDLGDEVVRRAGLAGRLVDVKVAAIDEDWSGLKFVWRKEHR